MGYIKNLRKIIGTRPINLVGACVLVVNKENKLLLQLRTDNHCWGLPGGSMELGESLEEVAERELLEETGLVAKKLELINVYSGEKFYYQYPNGDEVFNVVAAYLCREFEGELARDASEVKELEFFSFDEIPDNLNPPDKPIIREFISMGLSEL